MATPSSKYAVDTTTTLANGTELKWTKQIKTLYPNLNDALDRSCTYSEMSSPVLSKTGYGFKQNMLTDQYAPAYGSNGANTRWAKGFTRTGGWTKKIWYGSVLVDMSANQTNVRRYFFGYTDTSASIINGVNGGNARILRDIKVNKMLFNVTIKGYKVSDYNNIDYTANPFSSQAPSEITIKLSELDANPNGYIVTMIYYNNTQIYGPNGAQKWLGGSVYPTFICYSSDVGGFHWIPFVVPTPNLGYSYNTQNGHPSWTGGSGTAVPVNLGSNYVFGCDTSSMSFTLPDTYANIDQRLQGLALAQYGYDSNWNHDLYFNKKLHSFGDFRCIELIRGNVAHSGGNPGTTSTNSIQTNLMLGITGAAANKMIAGLGLYFVDGDEDFDPNDENITPDTMYTSQHIWLGEMSDHGITTGRWVKGSDIENYTGPNKNGVINDPDYKPGGGGGGETDDNFESMTTGFVSNSGGLTKYWKMSSSELLALLSDFNQNAPQGSSLSQNIVSLYVNAMSNSWSTGKDDIVIHAAGSQETPFTSAVQYDALLVWTHTKQLGYIDVPRVTNTFYDFSPYSTYELFIPFCGWIGLPDTVAGRRVRVEMNIDISNMSCLGIVRCERENGDSVCIGEITGTFGAPCPIQVIESGLYRQAMANSALQIAAGVGQVAYAGASGNYGFAIGGASMALQGAMQAAGVGNTNYGSTIGRNGDSSALGRGHDTYLKITHPVIDPVVETTGFAHSIGYMCNEVGTLNNFSGFTVCGNPHISGINATDAEKEEIKQLLERGVIL